MWPDRILYLWFISGYAKEEDRINFEMMGSQGK